MSFILDALRKAEAERHLGQLPGIHSPSVTEPSLAPDARPTRRGRALAVAFLILAAAALAIVWQQHWFKRADPVTRAPASAPVSASAPAPAPAPAPATPALVPPEIFAGVQTAAPAVMQPPLPSVREIPVPPPAPKLPTPAPVLRPAVVAASIPVKAAAPEPVMTMAQLPAALRSELPPIAISGSMYSANPAERMLLVDKRMLREGDEVAAGLVVDRILPKGAILRYKGTAFRLTN
jgi:general secretion pathway protein B